MNQAIRNCPVNFGWVITPKNQLAGNPKINGIVEAMRQLPQYDDKLDTLYLLDFDDPASAEAGEPDSFVRVYDCLAPQVRVAQVDTRHNDDKTVAQLLFNQMFPQQAR